MFALVVVITPKLDGGATPELPFQLEKRATSVGNKTGNSGRSNGSEYRNPIETATSIFVYLQTG